jgi:hypothetical protein
MEIKQNKKSSVCLLKFLVAIIHAIQALTILIIEQHCSWFTIGVDVKNKGKYPVISVLLIPIIPQHATTIKTNICAVYVVCL